MKIRWDELNKILMFSAGMLTMVHLVQQIFAGPLMVSCEIDNKQQD